MKRFNMDDEEDFQDDNLFPDTDDDDDDEDDMMDSAEYTEMMERQEGLALMQLDLVQLDLNQRLLTKAIELVKKNTWFFSLRSKKKQLIMISDAYNFLKNMVSIQEESN